MLTILKHKLAKDTLAYTLSMSAAKLIAFLLLPILTRYLTPSDYGIVATFQVILSVIIVLVSFNTLDAILVNYFKIEKKQTGVYVGNILLILFINFVLTISIIYLFKNFFSHLLKFPENWLITIVIVALSQIIITLALILWQAEQKPLPYGLFNILQTIISVSFSLYFIIILGLKWQGMLLGIIIPSVIFGIIGIFSIYKRGYIKFSFNKNYIKDALFIGIPLIPHALGGVIRTGIDRIFINSMVGISATGIYTVGYQVGMIIGLLSSSFSVAWAPFFFSRLQKDNYHTKIKIVKFIYIYSILIIGLALLLGTVAPSFLKIFVGENFQGSSRYVMWIAVSYAFAGISAILSLFILYVKKTYVLSLITFSSAILNVILNYWLIKYNGALGASQALFLTYLICCSITWIIVAKLYKMPWGLKKYE